MLQGDLGHALELPQRCCGRLGIRPRRLLALQELGELCLDPL
jgi:hypothetical protein